MTMNCVYLADGQEIRAEVTGHYKSGMVEYDGRTIPVERLAPPFEFAGYGELVPIKLQNGQTLEAVLQPHEYEYHIATIDVGERELRLVRIHNPGDVITSGKSNLLTAVYDQSLRQWRERTDGEIQL